MDTACLDHCLTHEERLQFEKNGFFIVEDALPPKIVDDLNAVLDRLEAELRPQQDLSPHERLNIFDFIGKDDSFLELLDWYKTFPKVWGNLGLAHPALSLTLGNHTARTTRGKIGGGAFGLAPR